MPESIFTPEQAAILEADQRARMGEVTPPNSGPALKTFEPTPLSSRNSGVNVMGLPRLGTAEMAAGVEGLINSQASLIQEMLTSKDTATVAKGKQLESEFDGFKAMVNGAAIQDGFTPPPAGNPDAVAARDYGIALDAKPSDYASMAVPHGMPGDRAQNLRVELGEVMASIKLDRGTGVLLGEHLAKLGPELRAMSPEGRAAWEEKEQRIAHDMAERRGTTLQAIVDNAHRMLQGHPLGKQIAESAMLSSATLLTMLNDHAGMMSQFERLCSHMT